MAVSDGHVVRRVAQQAPASVVMTTVVMTTTSSSSSAVCVLLDHFQLADDGHRCHLHLSINHQATRLLYCNVNVEFKVTLHEQVRYRGSSQY